VQETPQPQRNFAASVMASLRVLFVGGPMYDPLYARLPEFERRTGRHVEVAAALPHPALNAQIADEFGDGTAQYDLISTHTKYAPSQQQWLIPLDGELDRDDLAAFHPRMLDLARIHGALYGLPRNLDVKLLYYRRDLFEDSREREDYRARTGRELRVPQTWEELRATAVHFARGPDLYGFAFPGRESGLFGHFFELHAMAGGRLLTASLQPVFEGSAGRWALGLLVDLHRRGACPPETPEWHYDEVAAYFREGRVAMTTDWPGGFYTYTEPSLSRVSRVFDLALYPVGPDGRHIYAGSHTFAIPTTVSDKPAALELLRFLTDQDSQLLEARRGTLPTHPAVLTQVRKESPPGSLAMRRWSLLEASADAALFPPPHPRWPEIEEAIWQSARAAIIGEMGVEQALAEMAARIRRVIG
jgi:multiple sugar transport system substrate-binding protein